MAPLVLGLDPSSTRTGYALMSDARTIVEAGYLSPKRREDSALQRIEDMGSALEELIRAHQPTAAIIEITSGKVSGRHRGHGAGLAVYGMAVGAIYVIAWLSMKGRHVVGVTEIEWTRGKPKSQRQRNTALEFPAYARQAEADGGADVSDAIELCQFFFGGGNAA